MLCTKYTNERVALMKKYLLYCWFALLLHGARFILFCSADEFDVKIPAKGKIICRKRKHLKIQTDIFLIDLDDATISSEALIDSKENKSIVLCYFLQND